MLLDWRPPLEARGRRPWSQTESSKWSLESLLHDLGRPFIRLYSDSLKVTKVPLKYPETYSSNHLYLGRETEISYYRKRPLIAPTAKSC